MTSQVRTIPNLNTSETRGTKLYRHGDGFIFGISSIVVFLIVLVAGISCFFFRNNRNRGHDRTKQEETGLEKGTLNSCPVITYAEAKHHEARSTGDDSCCSVCLVDYGEEDELRMLPQCGHLFHVHCVDPWLWMQPKCPLCRSSIYASVDSPC